jgi:hypothetical protein
MAAERRDDGLLRRSGAAGLELAGRAGRLAALPAAALAIYLAGAWCLWQYAARRATPPAAPEVDARQCPWLSPADVAGINSGVELAGRATLFDRGICRRVAAAYRGNPWVERVVSVRRRFPGRLEVELAIRKPAAYVNRAGRYYTVDRGGCRLPISPAGRPEARWPVIEGVVSAPPAAGETWNDECLADGLRLVEVLTEVLDGHGAGMRLVSVEALKPPRGAYDQRPQLTARTASGLMIDWGSFNESRTYALPSAAEKRAELERQIRLLPDPYAVSCISVRFRLGFVKLRPEGQGEPGTMGAAR